MPGEMTFGLRIAAKDDTQGALRSVLSGVQGLARAIVKPIEIPWKLATGAAGIARDFEQGVRPLFEGLNKIIERGAGLEIITKSFAKLTGKTSGDIGGLGEQLVGAAHGMLGFGEALQEANRGLAAGLGLAEIKTMFEFISRKAPTTGRAAAESIDEVMTGLARGSTRGLEALGIVQGGMEAVKQAFDAVHGEHAFDSLGPAAQKAAVMRQAVKEMAAQMDKLGVSGQETIFTWSRIKNQISDAIDDLFGAVAGSKALHQTLEGVRDVIAGMAKYVRGGGSPLDLLFGKEGGKSGGLLGGLKALIKDVGEELGGAILSGAMSGIKRILAKLQGEWRSAWSDMQDDIIVTFNIIGENLKNKFTEAVGPMIARLQPIINWVQQHLGAATSQPSLGDEATSAVRALPGAAAGQAVQHGAAYGAQRVSGAIAKQLAEEDAQALALRGTALAGDVIGKGASHSILGMIGRGGLGLLGKILGPAVTIADFLLTAEHYLSETLDYDKALKEKNQAKGVLQETQRRAAARGQPAGVGMGWGYGGVGAVAARSRNWLKQLSGHGGGGFGRSRDWTGQFAEDFPGEAPAGSADTAIPISALDPGAYPLRLHQTRERQREINRINREIRAEQAAEDHKDKFEIARRRTAEVKRLRDAGADVRREDWGGIEEEIRQQLRAEHEAKIEALARRREELYGRLDESARARRLEPFERRRGLQRLPERPGDFGPIDKTDTRGLTDGLTKAAQEIADSSLTTNRAVQDFIRGLAGVAAELAGARMKLQACGPRRR